MTTRRQAGRQPRSHVLLLLVLAWRYNSNAFVQRPVLNTTLSYRCYAFTVTDNQSQASPPTMDSKLLDCCDTRHGIKHSGTRVQLSKVKQTL